MSTLCLSSVSSTPSHPAGRGLQERDLRPAPSSKITPEGIFDAGAWLPSPDAQIRLAIDQERKRISRELHDEVGQALTIVNFSLAHLKRLTSDDQKLCAQVDETQRLLEQTHEIVHHLAHRLRPETLDRLGIQASIRAQLGAFTQRTGIPVVMRSEAELQGLDGQQEAVLYRVIQESLTNIARHAHATRVRISFHRQSQGVAIEIHDNGRAFDPQQIVRGNRRKRLGLVGMAERVRLVRGDFSIDSAPGRGTTVRVRLPFNAAPAVRQHPVDDFFSRPAA